MDMSKRTIVRAFKVALNEIEQGLFEYLYIHKPYTLSEMVSHLEDYTVNIEERWIRGWILIFGRKVVEKTQHIQQEILK